MITLQGYGMSSGLGSRMGKTLDINMQVWAYLIRPLRADDLRPFIDLKTIELRVEAALKARYGT